jgi:hypothetical protein
MKFFALLFLLSSLPVLASDSEYATGSFDVVQHEFVAAEESTVALGTFSDSKATRLPASINSKKDADVTMLTGTFE